MANHRETLEFIEAEAGEVIEAIVVGPHYSIPWDSVPLADENVILSREAGLAKLDLEYDSGFGGEKGFPFFAWTSSRVIFVYEYDGATSVHWVPRNPMAGKPDFSGLD